MYIGLFCVCVLKIITVLRRQHQEYLPELAQCISLQDGDYQGIKDLPYSISTYAGGRVQPAAGWEEQTGVGARGKVGW